MFYIKEILIFFIYIYKIAISPLIGPYCRFYPTCSQYSIQVLKSFGIIKGIFFTIKRLIKCHPFSKGGIDEVPMKFKDHNHFKEY